MTPTFKSVYITVVYDALWDNSMTIIGVYDSLEAAGCAIDRSKAKHPDDLDMMEYEVKTYRVESLTPAVVYNSKGKV